MMKSLYLHDHFTARTTVESTNKFLALEPQIRDISLQSGKGFLTSTKRIYAVPV